MTATVVVDIVGRDNYSSTLGNFGNILTGLKSAIDLVGDGFRAFTGFAMEGLEAIGSYERLEASLTSLVASQMVQAGVAEDVASAMGVASLKAQELVQWNEELAINSPFTSEGVAQAFRMAMAYGFTADESKRLTEAMIDFASGTGATEASMQAIARALGQISATGKVTGGDMLQLVNAGLPVAQILADAFGVTTAEIMDMREKGLLPAKESIEAITVYLETNFAGAAERQALTWAGLLATFEDLKQIGLREFFGGLADAIQPLAVAFAEWMQTEGFDRLREWGDGLATLTTNLIEFAQVFTTNVRNAFEQGGIGEVILSLADEIDAALADLVSSINWTAIGTSLGDMVGQLFGAIFGDGIQGQESELAPVLGQALADLFVAAFAAAGPAIDKAFADWSVKTGQSIDRAFANWSVDIGDSIKAGIINGLNAIDIGAQRWVDDHIINPIKRALGIASPSSVFAEIGRNVVLGLIAGITSMAGTLLNMITGIVEIILAPLQPVLDLLGVGSGTGSIGTSSTVGSGSGLGGLGGGTAGSGTGGGTATGGGVTNNFYGTVNFNGLEQVGYDCPSPNPLVAASGNTLLAPVTVG